MKIRAIIILSFMSFCANAQEYEYDLDEIYRSPIKKILNKFSITISTGYNSTTYKHSLNGFYYLQSPTVQYIALNDGKPLPEQFDVYAEWLNDPQFVETVETAEMFDVPHLGISNPVLNPLLNSGLVTYNADSLGLSFQGRGWGIPINLGLRYNYNNIRVGFGFSMEFHKIKTLKSSHADIGVRDYAPNFSSAFFYSYYGQLGYKFYDYWDYSFAAELAFGKNKMGSNFNKMLMNQGIFMNFGVSIEKNLSEYFRIIVKPSYDFKSYIMTVPDTGATIDYKNPTFKVNFGVSITFPEIPRSPVKSDHVQLKHVITNPETGRHMEVRGQPLWKIQNPKVGQNYRKLERYKFKNRKKLNPY